MNEDNLAFTISEEISRLGKSPTYERLLSIDYKYPPVDPETYLLDPYYMGRYCNGEFTGSKLYDKWLEVLLEVLNPSKNYYELISELVAVL